MARSETKVEIADLTAGLNTDSTELTTPQGTTTDEDNFDITKEGTRKRRRALALETGTATVTNQDDNALSNHRWNSVAKDGNTNFEVVQVANTLHFYDVSVTPLHDGKKSFTVDLSSFKAPLAQRVDYHLIDVASGKGVLFVSGEFVKPFYIEYDPVADTISTTEIALKIRDLTQLDTTDPETQGTTLSTARKYDLLNQGWYQDGLIVGSSSQTRTITIREGEDVSVAAFDGSILDGYFSEFGKYPPKTKPWWVGKGAISVNVHEKKKGVFNDNDFTKDFVSFSKEAFDLFFGGNTVAPLGHYIVDPFYKDRSTASGIVGVTTESKTKRPTSIAFYAGRVFYAVDNTVYYSQVILDDLGASERCYQEADPTAEDSAGLVASDGGLLTVPNIGNVLRMMVVQGSLVLFADNGVWFLYTPEGTSFRSDSFQVNFVTSQGIIGPQTLVDVEGLPFYWSEKGIYALQPIEGRIGFVAVDVTETKINNYYNNTIPIWSRKWAKGEYDSTEKVVRWIHGSGVESISITTAADLTFASGYINDITVGDLGETSWETRSMRATSGHFLHGEDGKMYGLATAGSTLGDPVTLYDIDGDAVVERTVTQFASDLDASLTPVPGSGSWGTSVNFFIAFTVPGTAYFWITFRCVPTGSDWYIARALYKINSAGAIVLVGGQGYKCPLSFLPFSEIVGTGFLGTSPTSSDVILAVSDTVAASITTSRLVRYPSIDDADGTYTIVATPDSAYEDAFEQILDTDLGSYFWMVANSDRNGGYFNRASFLPQADGCKMISYVGKGEIDWAIANPGSSFLNSYINTNRVTYPSGFLVTAEITTSLSAPFFTVATPVINNALFDDSLAADLVPFTDVGLQNDASTGGADDDWFTPDVYLKPGSNGGWTVFWHRRYSITTTGLYASGSYTKVIIHAWDTAAETSTYVDEDEGAYFVPGTDVAGSLHTNVPQGQSVGLRQDGTTLVYANWFFGATSQIGNVYVVSTLGTFNLEQIDTFDARFAADKMLNFHTKFGAWYPYSFAITTSPSQYVAGIVRASTIATSSLDVNIIDSSGNEVLNSALTNVVISQAFEINSQRGIKYMAITSNTGLQFGEFNSETFLDWGTEDAPASLTTFYHLVEDNMTQMQAPYIYTYLKRTGTTYQADDGDGTI